MEQEINSTQGAKVPNLDAFIRDEHWGQYVDGETGKAAYGLPIDALCDAFGLDPIFTDDCQMVLTRHDLERLWHAMWVSSESPDLTHHLFAGTCQQHFLMTRGQLQDIYCDGVEDGRRDVNNYESVTFEGKEIEDDQQD